MNRASIRRQRPNIRRWRLSVSGGTVVGVDGCLAGCNCPLQDAAQQSVSVTNYRGITLATIHLERAARFERQASL